MDLNKVLNFFAKVLPTDPFGNVIFFKRVLIGAIGLLTYGRFNIVNRMTIEGTENLKGLPNNHVLFLSNHQTYFADVIAFYHIFCSVKWGFKNTIRYPIYLLNPRVHNYFVAAAETMKDSGIVPKIFSYTGAVTVERSWRSKGQNVQRTVDTAATDKVRLALSQGWVVSFPQGTTSPYAPIRKGTGHMIKEHNPIVVPIVINGFRRAFDKKGFFFRKRGTELSVKFKPALRFTKDQTVEEITEMVTHSIEQEIPAQDWWEMKPED